MDIKQLCLNESDSLSSLSESLLYIADEFDVLDDSVYYKREESLKETIDEFYLLLERIPSMLKSLRAFKHQLLSSRQDQLKALKAVK